MAWLDPSAPMLAWPSRPFHTHLLPHPYLPAYQDPDLRNNFRNTFCQRNPHVQSRRQCNRFGSSQPFLSPWQPQSPSPGPRAPSTACKYHSRPLCKSTSFQLPSFCSGGSFAKDTLPQPLLSNPTSSWRCDSNAASLVMPP